MAKNKLQVDFFKAVSDGNLDKVKDLISSGIDLNHRNEDETTLIIASREDHLEIVKYLKETGTK